jgi:DNA-directed RNA polymerase subunit M
MIPKKEGSKTVNFCPKCNFKVKEENPDKKVIKEQIKKGPSFKFDVVEKDSESYPLTEIKCEECGHEKAYTWEVQTRAADEPATKFFKCEKCKHVWRDYS